MSFNRRGLFTSLIALLALPQKALARRVVSEDYDWVPIGTEIDGWRNIILVKRTTFSDNTVEHSSSPRKYSVHLKS